MAHTLTFIREVPKGKAATAAPKAARMPKPAKASRGKTPVDPAGRVDLLAIQLLEVAVATYGDIPLRTVYGTYKDDIDRMLRRKLGKVKMYIPPAKQVQGGDHAA